MKSLIEKIRHSSYTDYTLLIIGWAIINFTLYQMIGVRVVNDSTRYIDYANEILTRGIFLQDHNRWYISYALYLAALQWLGLGIYSAIGGQVIFSVIAVLCLYETGLLFNGRKAGLYTAFAFLLWITLSQWNFYVLCESLSISLTAISFYLVVRVYKDRQSIWLAIPLLLITFFIKPTGIWISLTGGTLLLYKYAHALNPIIKKWILVSVGVASLCLVNKMLGTYRLIETYSLGEIVYDATTVTWLPSKNGITIMPPTNLSIPSKEDLPLIQLVEFIFLNPIFFGKLFLGKLFLYLLHIKPYYSKFHNVWIVCTLYPSYVFAVRGIIKLKDSPMVIFISSYIGLHLLTVALTTEDWDGRFLMPILPIIFAMSGIAVADHWKVKENNH